jgi:glycosyltransferase involved in cell wall biosynthesis
LPVVATDKPGINEYPPEETAVFFWPREPGSLAVAIDEAIGNIAKLAEAAREHAQEFHVDHTIDTLDVLYRDIIDNY